MAERKRSMDGHQETKDILGEKGSVSHGGRTGGRLAREIGSED
ncbi:hypothetical protein [Leisingera sp. ANG-DT]|nr:hypothetical protein [Leisingera sp. ANG-DT]